MNQIFALLLVIALDCHCLAEDGIFAKPEKIKGDPHGFYSSRKPFALWQTWTELNPLNRFSGAISKECNWSDVQSVQILHCQMHLLSLADIERCIKAVLSDAEFLKAVPDNRKQAADDRSVYLQALLEIKDGTYVLLSVTDDWAVLEHKGKIGLIQWAWPRPKPRNEQQPK